MSWVEVTRRGSASWARIDRPDRGNAISPEVVDLLIEWVRSTQEDASVRALVLTGTGKAFCAGADVKTSHAMAADPDRRRRFFEAGARLMTELGRCAVPVIAAVNGVAFAGGFELALACDLIVADSAAELGDLHLPHARIPAWGSAARLFAALGPYRAVQLLLLPRRLPAEELERLGLVAVVADERGLVVAVDELVATFDEYDVDALHAMKKVVAGHRDALLERTLEDEWRSFTAFLSADRMAALPPGVGAEPPRMSATGALQGHRG